MTKILSILSGPYYLEEVPNSNRNTEYIGYLLCRTSPVTLQDWFQYGEFATREVWFKDYKKMESVIKHFYEYPNQSIEVNNE